MSPAPVRPTVGRVSPHRSTRTRRVAAVAAAASMALALSACGAGLRAQTYQIRPNGDTADVAVNGIAVRGISILPPSRDDRRYEVGEDARARFTVVNDGPEDDRLVSVTSPAATEVVVLEGNREAELEVDSLTSTGQRYSLVLRGLTRPLSIGELVEMTFRFAENGEVTALVPVQIPEEELPRSEAEEFHPEGVFEREHGGEEGAEEAGERFPQGESGQLREDTLGEDTGGESGEEQTGTEEQLPGDTHGEGSTGLAD